MHGNAVEQVGEHTAIAQVVLARAAVGSGQRQVDAGAPVHRFQQTQPVAHGVAQHALTGTLGMIIEAVAAHRRVFVKQAAPKRGAQHVGVHHQLAAVTARQEFQAQPLFD